MKGKPQVNCEFGEAIVSYLYEELPLVERERFENHLPDCAACTDEFAAVAASRFEVYEWTKEFAEIPTPPFVIPYDEPVTLAGKVRRAFAFSWGWSAAGVSFASIALILAFGYFVWTPTGGEIAGVQVVGDKTVEVVAPLAITQPPKSTVASEPATETGVTKTKVQPIPVKATRPAAKRVPAIPQETRFATTDRRTLSSPRLTEFDDETDDSLRLAELFEDVESSE